MKLISLIIILFTLIACKNESDKTTQDKVSTEIEAIQKPILDSISISRENIELKKQQSIEIKQKELIDKIDEKEQLDSLLISKVYVKEADLYTIDFSYPLLNEEIKESYSNFNDYVNDHYVNITGTEAGILEDKELICDTIPLNRFREKRYIDYKIYNLNDQLVSVLFYKENFYSGTLHPTYSFDCLNFDLSRSVFMKYEDFFVEGSEDELRGILNEEIRTKIKAGDLYYDCWEISSDDFFNSKNNFVLDDNDVEYYFDDCIVCPSYTGSYSVKIPLEKLLPVLRRYDINPLVF